MDEGADGRKEDSSRRKKRMRRNWSKDSERIREGEWTRKRIGGKKLRMFGDQYKEKETVNGKERDHEEHCVR